MYILKSKIGNVKIVYNMKVVLLAGGFGTRISETGELRIIWCKK